MYTLFRQDPENKRHVAQNSRLSFILKRAGEPKVWSFHTAAVGSSICLRTQEARDAVEGEEEFYVCRGLSTAGGKQLDLSLGLERSK